MNADLTTSGRATLCFAVALVVGLPTSLTSAQPCEPAAGLSAPVPRSGPRTTPNASGQEAIAEVDAEDAALGLELALGTTFPLDISPRARLVFGERFFVSGSFGANVYGAAFGAVIQAFGADQEATVVEQLVSGALVGRVGAGVRPFGRGGPDLWVGYTHLQNSAEYLASDFSYPSDMTVTAAAVVHAVVVEIGWNIELADPLFFRPSLGFFDVVAESVEVSTDATSEVAEQAREEARQALGDAIMQYGLAPTVSLSAGVRF